MITSKVRLYDLARELKIDTKRLIEEVRREGVDVSVPSNSISGELADKVRNKYFPKKEVVSARTVRVVKKAARVETIESAESVEDEFRPLEPALEAGEVETPYTSVDAALPASTEVNRNKVKPLVSRVIKKMPVAEHSAPVAEHSAIETQPPIEQPDLLTVDTALPETVTPASINPSVTTKPSPSNIQNHGPTQVRVMRPTTAALSAGIRPGEKIPQAPPPVVDLPQRAPGERRRGDRTKGATSTAPEIDTEKRKTPQIVYTPSTDQRKPGGRNQRTRRGSGKGAAKHRHFEQEFTAPPRPIPIEDRIARELNFAGGDLKSVRLIEGVTVKGFAEKLGIKPKDIVSLLLKRGVLATLNQPLNDDVAIELGGKFGFDVSFASFEVMAADEEIEELIAADADDVELPRAPVVTVMGHVDHGKTSLLDAIRATNVAEGEAGGITQHIGAYSVQVPNPDDPTQTRRVVFLDTPGHEAFTMMRARGAKATDVVILVVAADDGVMPQTIEAIEHARAANVPVVVAINKIDKSDANPDRVKQELANHGLQPIEWGGETEVVSISAKKRQHLDALLETVLLTSDLLNLRASQTRRVSGVVLEAKLDRGRGAVATVLVQQGTLRVGDPFIVGQVFGKVRAMLNDRGEITQEAGPASPVEVLGMQGVPQAGDSFQVVADITRAQQISHQRQMASRQSALAQTTRRGIETLGQKEVKELLVIVKADVQGSVEV
ncbi:MAG: translation initiation factor IF-2, partial [Pyrinomonadaceae bacterium]